MPTLPGPGATLLVRTDFSDDDAWDQVRDESQPEYRPESYYAVVELVSDPGWAGVTWEALKSAAPVDGTGPSVLFIADSITFASPEHPILVVDLDDKRLSLADFPEIAGRAPFRCTPSAMARLAANRNLSNIGWEEYADKAADDGGVMRGFYDE